MDTSRRTILASGLAAGAAAPMLRQPGFLSAASVLAPPSDSVLVVLQVRGGWDQLQLLAEIDHPKYQAARPNIKLAKAKALSLATGAQHYWHPALAPFKALYDNGDLALIENIGYPNPNLSHFTSERKWYAGDPNAAQIKEGWLGAWVNRGYTGSFQIPAINVTSRLVPSFTGSRVPVFRRVSDFRFAFDTSSTAREDNELQLQILEQNAKVLRGAADPLLLHIAGATADAVTDSALLQSVGAGYSPKATYTSSATSRYLQIMARYITGGLKTRVYYTQVGGFDTHANEVVAGATETGTLADRVGDVASSVKAFIDDLKAHNEDKRVVVMLFSEFGRRLGENGSLGTDHGHGGLALVAGTPVVGGRYGTPPDLSKATTPYNRYYIPFDNDSTDFRSLYATLLDDWLGADHTQLLGGSFSKLGCV